MRGPHNLWRLIRTGATFERTGAMAQALAAMQAPPRLRMAARVLGRPFAWLGLPGDPALPPVVRALTALGPAYIKFGQTLATRPDIVGPRMAGELRYLQDRLPPFGMDEARAVIAEELGAPVAALFSEFSPSLPGSCSAARPWHGLRLPRPAWKSGPFPVHAGPRWLRREPMARSPKTSTGPRSLRSR